MKILSVVGARPQFIKAAVISRLIRDKYSKDFREILVHTGQHYDSNMSDVFFDEMDIPAPTYNLEVNERSHGAMTGKMLIKIEELLLEEKPDMVLVYGDTNSTLAGALAASKLHIPVAHVEAGLRSFWKRMPEEQNRILTDHLSDFLFCSSNISVQNLQNERIVNGVFEVGDIMLDSFNYYNELLPTKELSFSNLEGEAIKPEEFMRLNNFRLLTLHRAENTGSKSILQNIFDNLEKINTPIVFPIHPRTANIINEFKINVPKIIFCIKPVGYFEMLYFLKNCSSVITDSGGLQKEAYFAKKPCYTLRNQTEWVETLNGNWNTLCNPESNFAHLMLNNNTLGENMDYYGNGQAGFKILEFLNNKLVS